MGSDIGDILATRSGQEPPEFDIIRTFIQEKFNETFGLQLVGSNIIISVKGSALAGSLRFQLEALGQRLQTDKRLIIRSS